MADNAYPMPGHTTMATLAEWEAYFTAAELPGVVWGMDPALNSSARTVTFSPGAALVRGVFKPVTAQVSVPIPAASSQNRVDRAVLRLNRDAAQPEDFVKFEVLAGTPSANPGPPGITQSTGSHGVFDLKIARWTSQSSGALTDLVDERTWVGNAPVLYLSHAKPSPPRLSLGIEIDTGQVTRWDGANWQSLIEDSGDIPVPLVVRTGTVDYGWVSIGPCKARQVNGVITFTIHARFDPSPTAVGAVGPVNLATLPASVRPRDPVFETVYLSGRIVARVDIATNGVVALNHITANELSGSTIIRFTTTYHVR